MSTDQNLDLFSDLSKLKISQNFNEGIGAKKALLHIPVRKPNRQEFFRVHPDENMRLPVAIIELKEEREVFLVTPDMAENLPGETARKLLVVAINRQSVLFLWPLPLELNESRIRKSHWNETAKTAAELATKKWMRMAANMALGAYEVYEATGNLPAPEWPDLTLPELMRIAFRDNLITSPDHIVIRNLRGDE